MIRFNIFLQSHFIFKVLNFNRNSPLTKINNGLLEDQKGGK